MKKVNLRDLYPDVYKTDHFVEVTEDVLETIRDSERAEAAYDRRMYHYKAHYSLDCENGIENAVLLKPQTPEIVLEEKQFQGVLQRPCTKGATSKYSPGCCKICSVIEREDLPNISEKTSSNFKLETVRQLWARFFSPVIIQMKFS